MYKDMATLERAIFCGINMVNKIDVLKKSGAFPFFLFRKKADLSNLTFSGGSRITWKWFLRANFQSSKFENLYIRHFTFVDCDFTNARFEYVSFDHSSFRNCNFTGAFFRKCSLGFTKNKYINCNLTNTTFKDCMFNGGLFYKCSFISTNFGDGNLGVSRFRRCVFEGFFDELMLWGYEPYDFYSKISWMIDKIINRSHHNSFEKADFAFLTPRFGFDIKRGFGHLKGNYIYIENLRNYLYFMKEYFLQLDNVEYARDFNHLFYIEISSSLKQKDYIFCFDGVKELSSHEVANIMKENTNYDADKIDRSDIIRRSILKKETPKPYRYLDVVKKRKYNLKYWMIVLLRKSSSKIIRKICYKVMSSIRAQIYSTIGHLLFENELTATEVENMHIAIDRETCHMYILHGDDVVYVL
jgi:uncharacterized protein YjbI with pentapeptide repeats